ncbi:MAG: Gfo/Idh/MocA family oxidoreductase [Bacteroidetes bacterium]|nr:Gfo/Idh/MocA family oxidoreductase [Bacteroidota bacterium]
MTPKSPKNTSGGLSRRDFIRNTATAAAAFTILPSYVISGLGHKVPSDRLNIAGVGVGGRGGSVVREASGENIVALCDVDWKYAGQLFSEFPDAKKYWDWRLMLDEMGKDIDAVIVGTPDHSHAIVSINAMKMGKHVYCEKPLTHSVWESRQMAEIAREYKVATQMGNQGNSGEGIRKVCEWIWDGSIGEISEVHCWTNRPIWPQGLERPAEVMIPPDTLNWDLFLGPAPVRPYNSIYHPWNWRGWWDFGTGALGDMACHIMDPVFMALKLKYPSKVQGSSTLLNTESAPVAEVVTYTFPARENLPAVGMPEVKVTWWDGGLLPPRPEELPEGEIMGRDESGGCLFIGTKGKIMCGCYGKNPFLLPLSMDEAYQRPAPTMRRVEEGHIKDWIRACKESPENRVETSSYFGYSGPLNEMVVMGVVAVRLQDLKRELLWDGENMRFTNISDTDEIRVVTSDKFAVIDGHPHFDTQRETMNAKQAAESYIKHTYREGWTM